MATGEHGHTAAWIPICAAVLALLAASTGLLAGLRATQANAVKGDAIIYTERAVDTYNEYDGRAVRQHIYEAQIISTTDPKQIAKLHAVADHEKAEKAPLLKKAKDLDEQSRLATEHAERILKSHEILAVGSTLFDVAIVLVSVTALVGGRLLPTIAVITSALGLVISLRGAFP
jgi:Domain of unknown function (DUF4337)